MEGRMAVKLLFWSAIVLLSVFSCKRSKERIIREKVDERVADFRKKETAKCRTALLIEAEKIADSLLLYEALQEVTDSLKQLRPFKPLPPAAIPPLDSAAVKPIFDDSK